MLHQIELFFRQFAGLIQDGQRNGRFTDVMQQPCHPCPFLLCFVQLQLIGQRQHQRTYRH
ncbi:hypothetical protein D3C71_2040160 [compost metagenome]